MSLTSFVNLPEVKAKLKPLRPKLPRKLNIPIKVPPRSEHYMLVGTAFDYLLRFELQRRAPHAICERWVAEYAPELICRENGSTWVGRDLLVNAPADQYMPPEEVAERMSAVLEKAKVSVDAYLKVKLPTPAMQAELAAHAIRLAKLDSVYREGQLEPDFEEADPEDIQDLLDLLAIVPFDDLLHDRVLLLNPTFGMASLLVGGADADLIAGDLLVDFKVTTKDEIDAKSLDQIFGYFLLARKQRLADPRFPVVNRLGLYFCRHGYLWSLEASIWTSHPEFSAIEEWFFEYAADVYGASQHYAK